MQFTLTDFFIGFFLMNAMPHLLCALFQIRFLSAFGFSRQGNLAYAFLNVIVALALFHLQYGISELINHGLMLGAGAMLLIYLVSGRYFYTRFHLNKATL